MANEFRSIRRALEQRLATVQDSGGEPEIAFENVKYDPAGESQWLRARIEYTENRPAAIGLNSQIKYDGVLFIDCFVNENIGTKTADDLAQSVIDLFPYSTELTEGSVKVRIRYSERAGGVHDKPWYFVPITISFYTYE